MGPRPATEGFAPIIVMTPSRTINGLPLYIIKGSAEMSWLRGLEAVFIPGPSLAIMNIGE